MPPGESGGTGSGPTPPLPTTALVNFEAGTIGGVDLDAPSDRIAAALGPDRVRTVQTRVEGEMRTVYVFKIGGADVQKNGDRVSFTSTALRTAGNLGVAGALADFDAKYGVAPITAAEELQCRGVTYRAAGRAVRACVSRGCTVRSCPVNGVEFRAEAGSGAPPPGTSSEPTVEDALGTIRQYYGFIRARDYRAAYLLWENSGQASGQSYAQFERGFRETQSVTVRTGTPGREEPGAGQRFIEIPVTVRAVTAAGQEQRFAGTYTLHRTVVDGATADQRAWRLSRAALHEAK